MIMAIDPAEITPLHEVRIESLLDGLTADMKENGWQGRPLLVIKRPSGFLAWTGSHRIAAAIKAGLAAVPCYVLEERKLIRRGFHATQGHVLDYERLEILRKIGDEQAIHLMWQEGQQI
jgi:ParB-like chromosome segregation protein Spo0J